MSETCANCDAPIGRLETPHVWQDRVVCAACYERLAPTTAVVDARRQEATFNTAFVAVRNELERPPAAEVTYHNERAVVVTSRRVVIFGRTFATRNITSTQVCTIPIDPRGPIVMGICGAIAVFLGVMMVADVGEKHWGQAFVAWIVGVGLLAVARIWFRGMVPSYALWLDLNSGRQEVLVSQNLRWVQAIIGAINSAIACR